MSKPYATTSFYLKLLEFLFTAKHQLAVVGTDFDLTSIQIVTLLLINENRPRPMKHFCTLFNCDASNVTGIIDGLERKGLVSRQSDPHDRRIKIVCLEATGKVMQTAILQRLINSDGFSFDSLDDDEAQQFVHIIEKLAAHNTSLTHLDPVMK